MSERFPTPQPRVIYSPNHPDGPDRTGPRITYDQTPPVPPAKPTPVDPPRPMAQIIMSGPEPVRNVLASILPRDDSSTSITTALDAVATERRAAVWRRDTAQANRRRALTDSRAGALDIESFERQAAEAAIELERLDAVVPELEGKLEAALVREAATCAEAVRAIAARDALAEDVARALPGYEAAAASLIRIAELAQALDSATDYARRAAAIAGMDIAVFSPKVDTSFLRHLVLPARGNEKPLFGSLPPYRSTHPYANQPNRVG